MSTTDFPLRDVATQDLGDEEIVATYRLAGDQRTALAKARLIAHEHTVELPEQLLNPYLANHVTGKVEVCAEGPEWLDVRIAYPAAHACDTVAGLLGLILGNASFFSGVRLLDVMPPASFIARVPGPRHGIAGIRERVRAVARPLCGTALKPLGASASELAAIARTMAAGGIDIIKDDDGLTDQVTAPWFERVRRCAEAVRDANDVSGGATLYAPNITGPTDTLAERAISAQRGGAGAVEIIPGLMGYDCLRLLRTLPDFELPIIAHSAWSGAVMRGPDAAVDASVILGLFPRMFGADVSAMPGFLGRFGVDRPSAGRIADAVNRPGPWEPVFTMPGGGLGFSKLAETIDVYGQDTVLLMSSALFEHSRGLGFACQQFRQSVDRFHESSRILR